LRTIKESSDELNPPATTAEASIALRTSAKSPRDYLALALATCGVGYMPIAPGTWGSAVGVVLYLLFQSGAARTLVFVSSMGWSVAQFEAVRTALGLVLLSALAVAGVWAGSRGEKLLGRKDPGPVVIDEVVGQLITLLALPRQASWWALAAAFLVFRGFDIWKPYPIRRLEALESGLGIMADDVLAGGYAAVLMSVIVALGLFV
jgi:phosphatidylglycerophosphatase A